MSQPPVRTAPERFAAILFSLAWAVAQQTGWGLSLRLIALITTRLNRIKHRFAALAARLAAGTYKPRRPSKAAPRKQPESPEKKPAPPKDPLPNTPGWLLPLEKSASAHRSQLQLLFQDPEMRALLSQAPEAMRKVLRPLCRMLAMDLPPVLVKPRTTPPRKRPARPAAPARPPSPPPWLAPKRPLPALTLEWVAGRPRLVWN